MQKMFDLSIALTLATWPALTHAVQNSWGGPQSSDKRDWFAGAISELIGNTPDADIEYVEEFLLQVMNDEFETNLEDGSGEEVAAKILGFRKLTLQGNFAMVDDIYSRWEQRQIRGAETVSFKYIETGEDEDDMDEGGDELEREPSDKDVELEQAPVLVYISKEKAQPKVDDEGFTEVVSKRRR